MKSLQNRSKRDPRELKICEFNLENLFVSMAYHEGQSLERMTSAEWREMALSQLRKKQKPLPQLWGLAEAIQDIDPDILMLVEVGGEESLENFNRHFLESRFDVSFASGNSTRGIDLGFLIRKNLAYRVEVLSNRDAPVEVRAWREKRLARFSRDAAELRLHDETGLKLILLLTHLKSKISTLGDPKGKDARSAEAEALAGIYEKHRVDYPEVPIVVGGDFNAGLESVELELLRRTDLMDFQDILETPVSQRPTLIYFDHAGKPHPQVLDYLLISPQLREQVVKDQSGVYRYKGLYGDSEPFPETLKARYLLPSDHYPVVLTITL